MSSKRSNSERKSLHCDKYHTSSRSDIITLQNGWFIYSYISLGWPLLLAKIWDHSLIPIDLACITSLLVRGSLSSVCSMPLNSTHQQEYGSDDHSTCSEAVSGGACLHLGLKPQRSCSLFAPPVQSPLIGSDHA